MKITHMRAAALASPLQAPPQFPHAARCRNQIAHRRLVREIIHLTRLLFFAYQLDARGQKLWRLHDGDRNRSRQSEYCSNESASAITI